MTAKRQAAAYSSIDADHLGQRLDQVAASPDDRLHAVILYGSCGIDKALDYCDALEIVKAMGAYQPVGYTVDAVELLY